MKILNDLINQRKGHYIHAVELATVYELEELINSLCEEFIKIYTHAEIVEFFTTLEVIYFDGENYCKEDENALHDFNMRENVNALLDALDFFETVEANT